MCVCLYITGKKYENDCRKLFLLSSILLFVACFARLLFTEWLIILFWIIVKYFFFFLLSFLFHRRIHFSDIDPSTREKKRRIKFRKKIKSFQMAMDTNHILSVCVCVTKIFQWWIWIDYRETLEKFIIFIRFYNYHCRWISIDFFLTFQYEKKIWIHRKNFT